MASRRSIALLAAGAVAASITTVTLLSSPTEAEPASVPSELVPPSLVEAMPAEQAWNSFAILDRGSGEYTFDTLNEMYPNSGRVEPRPGAQTIFLGRVQDVTGGIGYSVDSTGREGEVVDFEDDDADVRWVTVTVEVDQVLAGTPSADLGDGVADLTLPGPPRTVSLEALRASLMSETILVFSSNKMEAFADAGLPVLSQEEAYFESVQMITGDLLFSNDGGGVGAPLLPEDVALQLVGTGVTFEDLVSRVQREA